MCPINLDNLKMPSTNITGKSSGKPSSSNKLKLPRHKEGQRFLKGPIPMDWIIIASNLTGKALHVGIALWHLGGMKNTGEVKLSGKLRRKMGIQRTTGYNALDELENAQLVSVKRHRGRNPIVTILEVPQDNSEGN
jgi:hypothetical protein